MPRSRSLKLGGARTWAIALGRPDEGTMGFEERVGELGAEGAEDMDEERDRVRAARDIALTVLIRWT